MTYRKILAALDTTDAADQVFERALTIARADGAELVLLHCSALPALFNTNYINFLDTTPDWTIDLQLAEEAQKQNADAGKELMERFSAKARAAGVNATLVLRFDEANRGICQVSEELKVDAVVIGRRGLSGLTELLLGSVSSYVIHHVRCDVLVVQTSPSEA